MQSTPLKLFQRVWAKWSGKKKWYQGHVKAVNSDGTYGIQYDDGDVEDAVKFNLISHSRPKDFLPLDCQKNRTISGTQLQRLLQNDQSPYFFSKLTKKMYALPPFNRFESFFPWPFVPSLLSGMDSLEGSSPERPPGTWATMMNVVIRRTSVELVNVAYLSIPIGAVTSVNRCGTQLAWSLMVVDDFLGLAIALLVCLLAAKSALMRSKTTSTASWRRRSNLFLSLLYYTVAGVQCSSTKYSTLLSTVLYYYLLQYTVQYNYIYYYTIIKYMCSSALQVVYYCNCIIIILLLASQFHARSCTFMHIHAHSCTFSISLGHFFFSRTFHAHCRFLMHTLAQSCTILHNHAQSCTSSLFGKKKWNKLRLCMNVHECAWVCMNVHEFMHIFTHFSTVKLLVCGPAITPALPRE